VIPAQFEYLAPASLEEALAALAEHGDEAKILAGGQSLLPVLRMRLNAPAVVIDLGKITSLRGIREDGDAIVIGAMTEHSVVGSDPLVAQHVAARVERDHRRQQGVPRLVWDRRCVTVAHDGDDGVGRAQVDPDNRCCHLHQPYSSPPDGI
jgi:sirohydrochlorin ferrochelatase